MVAAEYIPFASELYLKYGYHDWYINRITTPKMANNQKEINQISCSHWLAIYCPNTSLKRCFGGRFFGY